MDGTISKVMLDEDSKIATEMSLHEEETKQKMFIQTITKDIVDDSFHRLLHILEMSSHFSKTLQQRLEKQKDEKLQFDSTHFWRDESEIAFNEDKYSRTIKGQSVSDRQPSVVTGTIMHPYQIDGYLWLKSLYENGVNGILADEMGLGKTLQCIALIGYLTEMGIGGPFLVCAPLSILPTWLSEITLSAPSLATILYHGSPLQRAKLIRKINENRNIVVLTSYEIAVRDRKCLQDYGWKYLILDEAHRIKNYRCRLVRELKMYQSANRLLLTGTPLQNDLSELWSMLNFLLPEIFTDRYSFQSWFDIIVLQSPRMENELVQREQETRIVAVMHDILTPFLLRRTKNDVNIKIPPKKQVLVCLSMTRNQKLLYQETLALKAKEELSNEERKKKPEKLTPGCMSTGKSEVSSTKKKNVIKILKRISPGHAAIHSINFDDIIDNYLNNHNDFYETDIKTIESEQNTNQQDTGISLKYRLRSSTSNNSNASSDQRSFTNDKRLLRNKCKYNSFKLEHPQRRVGSNIFLELLKIVNHPFLIKDPDDWCVSEDLVLSSGKMAFLDQLLPLLKHKGHRVLIYSQLNLMLDILEKYCELRSFRFVRLDGSMSMESREESLKEFSTDIDVFIFLLSTRAGGLGLNLLSADTVVLFDSDWNPQRDLQAQDRCHRIGQTKPVVVYRLMIENSVDQRVLEKACSKRKLEKMIIKKRRFLTGCHENRMTPEDLSEILKNEDYSMIVRPKGKSFTSEQLKKLTDRSDLTECCLSGLSDTIDKFHKEGLQTSLQSASHPDSCSVTMNLETYGQTSSAINNRRQFAPDSSEVIVKDNYFQLCYDNQCQTWFYGNYIFNSLKGENVFIAYSYNISYALYMRSNGMYLEFCEAGYVSKLMVQILERLQCSQRICYQSQVFKEMGRAPFILPLSAVIKQKDEKTDVVYSPIISARSVLFYVRAPKPMDKLYAFIAPFELFLWLSLFGTIILLPIILCIIAYCGGTIERKQAPNLFEIFFSLIQSGLRQDINIEVLPGAAVKLSVLIWMIAIFILTSSYSGAILSHLSVPIFEPVVSTFQELGKAIEDGRYSCGTVKNYAIKDLLNDSSTGLWKILRDSMLSNEEENIVVNVEEGLKLALQKNYAFISYDLFTKPVLMKLGENKFFVSQDSLFTSYAASSFHNDFQFRREFGRMINRYHQGGIIDKLYNDEIEDLRRRGAFYSTVDSNEYHPLQLSDVLAALYLLAGGYFLALLVFCMEFLSGKICEK